MSALPAPQTVPVGPADDPGSVPAPGIPPIVWAVIVAGTVTLVGGVLLVGDLPTPPLWRLAAAIVFFLLGDIAVLHIRFGHDQDSFTLGEIALLVGITLLPLPWLVVVAPLCVVTAHAIARRAAVKAVFNGASFAVAALLAGSAYAFIVGDSQSLLMRVEGLVVASAVFFLWNTTTIALAVASSQRLPLWRVYGAGLLLCVFVWVGNTGIGILIVVLAASGSTLVAAVPILLGLLFLMYWSYLHAMRERDLWQQLQTASRELLHAAPSQIAPTVVELTPPLFSAEFVELLLVDEGAREVSMFRWLGDGDVELVASPPLDSNPYWEHVLNSADPFEVGVATAPPVLRRELMANGLERCIVAPLRVNDRYIGMLRIGFRGRVKFTAREMQVLTTFSHHVSATVDNTRLFETLRGQALRDPLTGLPNRTVLLDHLQLAQARSRRSHLQTAVIFLDLDRFKMVNDSLGHEAGDVLLIEVAQRISRCLRPGDTAARLGGDEFVVLCEEITSAENALEIAQRLSDSVSAPYTLLGQQIYISASVGVSLADDTSDGEALLRDADTAMYQAKGRGRARCELFDETLRDDVVGRLQLEHDLRLAVERGQMRLEYQPNVALSDEGVVGVEALARWHSPERGIVQPTEFISVAEDSGAIIDIGRWVIEEACRQLAHWTASNTFGEQPIYMAINLSPLQLAHPNTVDHIASVLRSTRVDPRMVCFEVTEGALVRDLEGVRDVLQQLRDLGVRTALDDFGTGYSSLSYLQVLPVDVLKLDQSFIARLTPDARDRAVVGGMVELAHALDLTVVAEGVETEQQLRDLRSLDCDVAQGFHFARPQSALALEASLPSMRVLAG